MLPGFLEEPGCTTSQGSVPHIARLAIAAEASILPKSDPIAGIHVVFGIDQILQSLHVDFPSGLLHRLGNAQQLVGILLSPTSPLCRFRYAGLQITGNERHLYSPRHRPFIASESLPAMALAASRAASETTCPYLAVIWALLWPNSLPIMGAE